MEIKLIAIQDFRYMEAKNLKYELKQNEEEKYITKNDIFYATKKQTEYLEGFNPINKCFVKRLEDNNKQEEIKKIETKKPKKERKKTDMNKSL